MCDANPIPHVQTCTLRAAPQQAHDLVGADTINFNIPGSEVKTISPDSELPDIEEQVTINGYSQPGVKPIPLLRAPTRS